MGKRGPFTFPKLWRKLDTLKEAMEEASKHPPIGITQGGSSGKYAGAIPAAKVSKVPDTLASVPQPKGD